MDLLHQPVAFLVLPTEVYIRPSLEGTFPIHLDVQTLDPVRDPVLLDRLGRGVDGGHLRIAQRDELNVLGDTRLGTALGNDGDAALNGPGERNHTDRAAMGLGNVGKELVAQDGVLGGIWIVSEGAG